jgi:hypothetical protein
MSNGPDMIPDSLPHRIGQELHRTLANVAEGFILRTLEASQCAYMVLLKAGLVTWVVYMYGSFATLNFLSQGSLGSTSKVAFVHSR